MSDAAPAAPALAAWLIERLPQLQRPLRVKRIAGGRSNLTLRVSDSAGASVIVRRAPESTHVASAHDMGREHRILLGLCGTAVPVPAPLGFCGEEGVLGAPFHVMEDVRGTIVRDAAQAAQLAPELRARASVALVSALAALHAVDLTASGLDALAPPDGYLRRQLRRWPAQWSEEEPLHAQVVALAEALGERCPDVPSCVVHGDYRLDNVVLSDAGEIVAVLDWELATLGDPLADLGMLLVYWAEEGDRVLPLGDAPTLAPGFATRAELVDAYAAASAGHALDRIGWYVAFSSWKLACILHGVWARAGEGAYGEDYAEAQELPGRVAALLDQAQECLHGGTVGSLGLGGKT